MFFFSSPERDNNLNPNLNCGSHKNVQGAWWYKICWYASLNGKYATPGSKLEIIKWRPWQGLYFTVKSSSMMIRSIG